MLEMGPEYHYVAYMHYFTCCISNPCFHHKQLPKLLAFILMMTTIGLSAQTPWKVLHYTETTGYNHNTKSQSLSMFNSWAATDNYTVTNDDNGNEFNSLANLQQYAVVIFSNTSGNSGLSSTQRANFEAYIAGGGSYLGIHAASDTYRHSSANGNKTGTWDWYAENVAGASVQESPNHTSSNHNNTMTKQVVNHPTLANVPTSWNKTEEYYYWENGYLNNAFTELLRVGSTGSKSYDAPRPMAHCKNLTGGGRAFYTALGHSGNNFTGDQNFQNLIHDALIWCAGSAPGSGGGTGGGGSTVAETISGPLEVWSDVVITFTGPQVSETGSPNPFMDFKLDVTFQNGGTQIVVPGYFAADGNAANTSAGSGDKWRVHFRPPFAGNWTYTASFRQGTNVAVNTNANAGSATAFDGATGTISIGANTASAPDLKAKGLLEYTGDRYLKFAGSGEYFVKAGADAPENFLGYYEFDNTSDHGGQSNDLHGTSSYTINGQTFVYHGDGLHHYDAHAQHWSTGDPTWQSGKGKNIIGSINYLASTGVNVFSFLTMNINGDGTEVYPYLNYNGGNAPQSDRLRFDVSKLEQWEIIFAHAESRGMFLHFKMGETENDGLLDGGTLGNERKVYYRELIARFGHHLALNWNIGEEYNDGNGGSGGSGTQKIKDYSGYIRAIDPYDHPVVLHTYPGQWDQRYDPLLGNSNALHGVSLQADFDDVHGLTVEYVEKSANSGYNWIVANDEQGPAWIGIEPDDYNNGNNNQGEIRHHVLWGNLMGGGAGVEYYFGYQRDHDDLESESWEARDQMWQYSKHALNFFRTQIPFWEMDPADDLIGNANNSNSRYCFAKPGEVYAIYLPQGNASFNLDLQGAPGGYDVFWFDPRNGGALKTGSLTTVNGGGQVSLGNPPSNTTDDWVIVVKANGTGGGGNPIPPTVSLTSPLNNASFTAGAAITVTATASDSDGSVSKVEFFEGTTLIGTDNTSPFSISWPNVTAGSYNIKAVATDNDGLTATSLVHSITVTTSSGGGGGSGGGGTTNCPAQFEEVNGLVVIEAESVPLVGDWQLQTAIPGYTGSGYYVWTGSNHFNNPGNGVLEYKVNITTTGTYRFQWRSRITQGTSSSDYNDNWLRFPDASDYWAEKNGAKVYPKGTGKTPNPAGATADGWFKIYMSQLNTWSWQARTYDNNPHEVFVKFDTPGVYTMQISARSAGHGIDRMVMYHSTFNSTTALDINQGETACQGGGGPVAMAPQIDITAPQGGATFTAGDDITISTSASDSDGTVVNVKFFQGGINLLGNTTSSPFDYTWQNVPAGTYTLTAKAIDNDGLSTVSSSVTITVLPVSNQQPPTVTLTNPLDNASYVVGNDVTMTATASDSDGNVVRVDFWEGSSKLGSDFTAPYEYTWTQPAAGSYAITAVAVDNTALKTTSSVATITVVGQAVPPVVSINNPVNNAVFKAGDNIAIDANASDSDGSIAKVVFYADNVNLGVEKQAPYEVVWNNVVAGTYVLTAVATDDEGNKTTSPGVTIVVDPSNGGGGSGNGKPTVVIIDPIDGSTLNEGDDIDVEATATDSDGSISTVKFYLNGSLYKTEKQVPYEAPLKNVQPGTYTLMAIATDDSGLKDTSIVVYDVVAAGGGGGGGGGNQTEPVVVIVDPLDGANFSKGDNIPVEATATDPDGSIVKVEFYTNGIKWRTEKVAPYTGQIKNVQPGTYELMAIAYDDDGLRDTSTIVYTVGTINPQPPFVNILDPIDGAIFKPGETIDIDVDASDIDGQIVKVEIFVDADLIQTEKNAPYEASWSTNQVGSYIIRAIAYDDDGLTTASNKVIINIQSGAASVLGLAFDAIIDDGFVILSWSAQEEKQLAEYRITKSADSVLYQALTVVPAVGNSTVPTSYDDIDPDPFAALSWYKLEAIATDGTVLQTLIVRVDLSEPEVLENWVIYPNPLSGSQPINVWANLSKDVQVTTELTSVFGAAIYSASHQFYVGQNKLTVGLSTLPPGIYFFTLRLTQSGEVLDTKVFIKTP